MMKFRLTNVIDSWSVGSRRQPTVSSSPTSSRRPIPQRQQRGRKYYKRTETHTKRYHQPLCPRPEPATATQVEYPQKYSVPCSSHLRAQPTPSNSFTYPPYAWSMLRQMGYPCRNHGILMCVDCTPQTNYFCVSDSSVYNSQTSSTSDSFLVGQSIPEPLPCALPAPYYLINASPESPRLVDPYAPHQYHHHHVAPQPLYSSMSAQSPQASPTPPKRSFTHSSSSSGCSKYSCENCGQGFTRAGNMYRHVKRSCDSLGKHEKKQIRCTECKDAEFTRPDALNKHMKKKHKRCSRCNGAFNTSEEVAKHRQAKSC
jgi:hypothetical protein